MRCINCFSDINALASVCPHCRLYPSRKGEGPGIEPKSSSNDEPSYFLWNLWRGLMGHNSTVVYSRGGPEATLVRCNSCGEKQRAATRTPNTPIDGPDAYHIRKNCRNCNKKL